MFTVQSLTTVLNQLLPEPQAGLLIGLLFGTKAALTPELTQALTITGTLHIAALSGMNINLVVSFLAKFLTSVFSKRLASLLTILGIIWFVYFVGPSPSVIRAAIMSGISLLAIIFGRQYWAILSWFLAVSIMLLLNMSWLTNLSFQLSVLASLGIILFGGPPEVANRNLDPSSISLPATGSGQAQNKLVYPDLTGQSEAGQNLPAGEAGFIGSPAGPDSSSSTENLLPKTLARFLGNLLSEDLHLTLAAQVFTIPVIFWYFHRISLISPLTNLLIGWTILPVSILGWVSAFAGSVWLPLGLMPAWLSFGLLQYLIAVVEWTARLPWASVGW